MTLEDDTMTAWEAARARVHAQTAHARAAADEAERMSRDVRTATATAVSLGREVRAVARAGGAVERIEIAAGAFDLDAATLSRIVTATVQAAQRDAAEAALRRMAESLGDDSALVAATRAQVDAQLGRAEDAR